MWKIFKGTGTPLNHYLGPFQSYSPKTPSNRPILNLLFLLYPRIRPSCSIIDLFRNYYHEREIDGARKDSKTTCEGRTRNLQKVRYPSNKRRVHRDSSNGGRRKGNQKSSTGDSWWMSSPWTHWLPFHLRTRRRRPRWLSFRDPHSGTLA